MSHHLLFDAEDAKRMGAYGVITPPLRQRANAPPCRTPARRRDRYGRERPFTGLREEKERGQADIWTAPPEMTGLQTLCASMLGSSTTAS